jgi:hypothetical protein
MKVLLIGVWRLGAVGDGGAGRLSGIG